MTLPAFVFGFLLSSLYGAAFHLWKGGSLARLFFYLGLSWAGFISGHLLGGSFGWTFLSVGPLNAGLASIGSLIFLGVGYWLSLVQIQPKPKPRLRR